MVTYKIDHICGSKEKVQKLSTENKVNPHHINFLIPRPASIKRHLPIKPQSHLADLVSRLTLEEKIRGVLENSECVSG